MGVSGRHHPRRGLAAWWLSLRRYRLADDTVHRTLPAWLLPVLAAVASIVAAPFYLGRPRW